MFYISNITYGFAIDKLLGFNSEFEQGKTQPFLLPFTGGIQSSENEFSDFPIISRSSLNHPGILDPKTQTKTPTSVHNFAPSIATTSTVCNGANLDDTFDTTYTLEDGQISPNGKWQNVYNGFGSSGVEKVNGKHVFFLKPRISTSPKDTQAALVRSTNTFCDYSVNFDINTVKQLRQNIPPNTWEAGWFIFRYTDTFHYYWFLIRSDGIELGKKDCDTCTDPFTGQQFLVTKQIPTLQTNTWHHWTINIIGNHIQISVDKKLVIDFVDQKMSPKLSAGNIAMYSEDAYVRYDNMHLVAK